MQTVLVVDDEPKIVQLARDYLEHAGFAVLTAGDGASALHAVRTRQPDLVVLDLGLPQVDGLEVMRTIRAAGSTPIVVLTARDTELDTLLGLELGADDYMTKPFSPRELVARVRAVLRRGARAAEPRDRIEAGDLVLDVPRLRARSPDGRSSSRPRSSRSSPRWPASRAACSRARSSSTRSTASRSRHTSARSMRTSRTSGGRSSPIPSRPRYVQTVYGVGYRVAEPTDGAEA